MTTVEPSAARPPFARRIGNDFELRLTVVPGASEAAWAGVIGDRLKNRFREPLAGGKTNRAVVELLSIWPAGAPVELVSGHGSPLKTVRVHGRSTLPAMP